MYMYVVKTKALFSCAVSEVEKMTQHKISIGG